MVQDEDTFSFDADAAHTPESTSLEASTKVYPDHINVKYPHQGLNREYQIFFDRMPLHGIARRAAWGRRANAYFTGNMIANSFMTIERGLGRPVTQAEAEGISLHYSRTQLYSIGMPYIDLAIAAGLTWRTRRTFKFPLRKSKPLSGYAYFPSQRMSWLTGPPARGLWHVTRFISYLAIWTVSARLLMGSVALTSQRTHMFRDERTKNLITEIRDKSPSEFLNSLKEQKQTTASQEKSGGYAEKSVDQLALIPEQGMDIFEPPSSGDDAELGRRQDGDSASSSRGSAWDRHRSAKTNSGSTHGRNEGDQAQKRTETEQERAQKEFDRILEAERNTESLNDDDQRAAWRGGKDRN